MIVDMQEITDPEQAEVKSALATTVKVNITNTIAQRKVSKLLLDQVGNLLYGEQPTFVTGKRLLWRVPVYLGLPAIGPVGQVGTLEVDAQTGEILFTQQLLDEIAEYGNALAERASPITG